MGKRSGKLIATNESTVPAKSFFDSLVVEDGEGNRCFPDPSRANESDGFEVFSESDDVVDKLVTTETVPRCRRR